MISAHVQFSVSRMTAGLIATDVASQVATATPLLLKVHSWHRFDAVLGRTIQIGQLHGSSDEV